MTDTATQTDPTVGCLLYLVWGLLIRPLLIVFAWNVGVVHAAEQAGGNVGNIGFVTALGLNVLIGVITAGSRA